MPNPPPSQHSATEPALAGASTDVPASPRVLIVDDHELFRTGLRDLLEEHGFTVVAEAADGKDAGRLAAEHAPDVAVMDLHMPEKSGVDALRDIGERSPSTAVLILTVSAEDDDVNEAILAGASGYLLKDTPPEQIIAGIRAAAEGEALLSPRIAADLLERLRGPHPDAGDTDVAALTDREREVLRLIAAGMDNPKIARKLFISVQTVKNHVSNILGKLGVANRVQAVAYAMRKGLI